LIRGAWCNCPSLQPSTTTTANHRCLLVSAALPSSLRILPVCDIHARQAFLGATTRYRTSFPPDASAGRGAAPGFTDRAPHTRPCMGTFSQLPLSRPLPLSPFSPALTPPAIAPPPRCLDPHTPLSLPHHRTV
jgi:hypothetical protein